MEIKMAIIIILGICLLISPKVFTIAALFLIPYALTDGNRKYKLES